MNSIAAAFRLVFLHSDFSNFLKLKLTKENELNNHHLLTQDGKSVILARMTSFSSNMTEARAAPIL